MVPSRADVLRVLVAPLPALTIGLLVMWRAGVASPIRILNLSTAVVGVVVFLHAARRVERSSPNSAFAKGVIAVGLLLLATTLLVPGPAGVRRWLSVGPLEIHVGALLLPPVLVLLGAVGRGWSIVAAFGIASVLLLQPDAGQAASFAVGWIVLVAYAPGWKSTGAIIGVIALAGFTLIRPDPLEPVPHVEEIVGMAATQGKLWLGASVVALGLLPLPFLLSSNRPAGVALAAYVTCTLVAAGLGNFPVPVMGYGVSPILGYYLGAAALTYGSSGNRSTMVSTA